jgi:hypothetical protein
MKGAHGSMALFVKARYSTESCCRVPRLTFSSAFSDEFVLREGSLG